MSSSVARARFVRNLLLAAFGAGALVLACKEEDPAAPKLCKPNQYSYCRCQDRTDGQMQCNEDGTAYSACEPCTFTEPYEPPSSSGSSGYVPPPEDSGPSERCGDGKPQLGEDCDDANKSDADGCSATCKLAGVDPTPTVSCPGLPVHVWGAPHAPTIAGSTVGSGNRSMKTACPGGAATRGSTAPDRVFQVTAHVSGTLTVKTTETTYDGLLYAAATCSPNENVTIACSNAVTGRAGEVLTLPVEMGKTYYVFVDGVGTASGKFRATFSID